MAQTLLQSCYEFDGVRIMTVKNKIWDGPMNYERYFEKLKNYESWYVICSIQERTFGKRSFGKICLVLKKVMSKPFFFFGA